MTDFQKLRRIDAHCHASFPAYGDESGAVIKRALADGTGMICVGTELGTSESAVAAARSHDGVWAAVGFHPSHLSEGHHDADELGGREPRAFNVQDFRRLILDNRAKVVAIGECGLDRSYIGPNDDVVAEESGQAGVFRAQIDLAQELDLVVIVHCRDLHDEVFGILEEYDKAGQKIRGVAHCFTGTWNEAERYLSFGFYVSFAGMVTYKPRAVERERGETLQDVAKRVPLDKILVETDAPWLLPVPYRGRKIDGELMKNEPAFVKHTTEFVAGLRGMPVPEFEALTLRNTIECFHLG